MMIGFLIFQLILLVLSGIGYLTLNELHQDIAVKALALAMGVFVATINTGALIWGWGRVMMKNSFALTGVVIVMKYAFLGAFLYLAVARWKVDTLFFLIGLSTFVPSLVLVGWMKSKGN